MESPFKIVGFTPDTAWLCDPWAAVLKACFRVTHHWEHTYFKSTIIIMFICLLCVSFLCRLWHRCNTCKSPAASRIHTGMRTRESKREWHFVFCTCNNFDLWFHSVHPGDDYSYDGMAGRHGWMGMVASDRAQSGTANCSTNHEEELELG